MSKEPAGNRAKTDTRGKKFAVNGKAGWWCWRKAWCEIIGLAVATCVCSQDSTFTTIFGTAVLCLDDLAPGYFYNTMRQRQRPYKTEDGAYWFKTSEQLFGAPLTDVFISDGSSRYDLRIQPVDATVW